MMLNQMLTCLIGCVRYVYKMMGLSLKRELALFEEDVIYLGHMIFEVGSSWESESEDITVLLGHNELSP